MYSEGLGYDVAGRIAGIEDMVQGVTTQWTYGYDTLGQLTSATRNGAAATTWGYDARGNRTAAGGVAASYDAQDRLQARGAVTYSWDALGGRKGKTEGGATTGYLHDGMGALLSVTLPDSTTVAYEYDGLQRRVAKRRGGVVVSRFVYDSQVRVVAELNAGGSVVSRFVYAAQSSSPDALVRGGVTYAYVKDHLGSVRLVVNAASGVVVQRLDYDAWGVVTQDTAPGFQPFAYAGGVLDADTGFLHFGFRDYDAASALWTARDPIRLRVGGGYLSPEPLLQDPKWAKEEAEDGFSTPAYSYARNNPVKYTDPTGLFAGGFSVPGGFTPAGAGLHRPGRTSSGWDPSNWAGWKDPEPKKEQCELRPIPQGCKGVAAECRKECSGLLGGKSAFPFWNCVNECLTRHGCPPGMY